MAGTATTNYVATDAAGTVYVNNNDRLVALDENGVVRWEVPNTSQRYARPINPAGDGTVYVGGLGFGQVTALNPDGTVRWAFSPGGGAGLLAGPSLGPDGNLYAIVDGLGTYSLDPDGNLRWVGEYEVSTSYNNSPIRFDGQRFFAGIDHFGGFASLHVYDQADGFEVWGSASTQTPWAGIPALDTSGRVIGRRWPGWIQALQAEDGQVAWYSQHPGGAQSLVWPAVGPDGAIYTGDVFGMKLWALEPDGTTRWVLPAEAGSIMKVWVAPDNSVVITTGRIDLGYVRGYAPADGALLWHLDLPSENDMPQYVSAFDLAFSPDRRTVYLATDFAGGVNNYGYLYAIALSGGDVHSDGFESGDLTAWSSSSP